ncbi:MAG: glycosyltransferase family 4 protein, partial [Acidobacteriota bacterium]
MAWFSPVPPSPSGIAAYTAEIVPLLRARGWPIDVFVHRAAGPPLADAHPALDYVWRARRTPYDLTVYQLGNASFHDYMWGYLFRYPGLVVLHDAQVQQSRALAMTRFVPPTRVAEFVDEFLANHPGASRDLAIVFAEGRGGSLYGWWPHVRLVIESARTVAVHNARLAADLAARHPAATIETIPMGVADPRRAGGPGTGLRAAEGRAVRERLGLPAEAFLVAAFGGVTPEKRIASLLEAVSLLPGRVPVHVALVGAAADHYDVQADIARWRLTGRVHVAGYVPDADLPAWLDAADVCACLRWPTNRETSASWLRALAAGRPTLVSGLADLVDVPTLDPYAWRVLSADGDATREPVAVTIEITDERKALGLALDRLAVDAELRERLGRAARAWWAAH